MMAFPDGPGGSLGEIPSRISNKSSLVYVTGLPLRVDRQYRKTKHTSSMDARRYERAAISWGLSSALQVSYKYITRRYTTRSGASFRAEIIEKERQRLSRKIKFSRDPGPSSDGKPAKVCVKTVKPFARCTYQKRRIGCGQKRNYMADELVAPVDRANKNGGQKCDSVHIQSQKESPSRFKHPFEECKRILAEM